MDNERHTIETTEAKSSTETASPVDLLVRVILPPKKNIHKACFYC